MNRIQFSSSMTKEILAQVETEIESIIYACILKYRNRLQAKFSTVSRYAPKISMLMCLVGGAISIWAGLNRGMLYHGLRVERFFLLFFVLVFIFVLLMERHNKKIGGNYLRMKMQALVKPLNKWSARSQAERMLRAAKKAAPFDAEYEFRNGLVSYYRIKDDQANFVWSRSLKGCYLSKNYFTFFFKSQKSIYPYGVVLHDPSIKLESYLKAIGLEIYEISSIAEGVV
jgi:hypothetical protein